VRKGATDPTPNLTKDTRGVATRWCNGVLVLRVRVEIMGSQKCGIVGQSQPVLIMINPIIFTRTRIGCCCYGSSASGEASGAASWNACSSKHACSIAANVGNCATSTEKRLAL
jgi:hypothetical protein